MQRVFSIAIGALVVAAVMVFGSLALAQAAIEARVTPHDKGLTVAYRLPAPVTKFIFEEAVADVRADTWRAPAGMTLADGVLSRKDGRPFRAFSVEITPDTASRDRRYPALTPVGRGWQIYGPYFRAAKGAGAVSVSLVRPKGWQVAPVAGRGDASRARVLPLTTDGYAYVGPADYVRQGKTIMVVAPDIAPALASQLSEAAEGAARFYAARLGVTPPSTPTLIVTRLPKLPLGMHGDTTDGPVISLRLLGDMGDGQGDDGGRRADLVAWVDHEIFHLWNSRFFHSRDGDREAWLHEGMAEYAALLASREQGFRTEAQVGQALAQRLTGCASALGAKGMAADAPRRGSGVYDCGVLVQWIADLKARDASGGREDVFDTWRGLFTDAAAQGGQYDADRFLALVRQGAGQGDALQLLMQPGGADRWTALVAALNTLGAKIAPTRSAEAEREQILYHLLRQSCRGSYGFYGGNPTRVKLDTGDRCGVLNGDPVIDGIAGRNIMSDTHAAWDAAARICAVGGQLELALDGKTLASVHCAKPMPPPPAAWTVEAWRRKAGPSG